LAPLLRMIPFEFCQDLWHQKARIPGLSCGDVFVILRLAVSVEHRLVADRQTHDYGIYHSPKITKLSVHVIYSSVLGESLGGRTEAKSDVYSCLVVSSAPCLRSYLLRQMHDFGIYSPKFTKFPVPVTYGSVLLWQQCNSLCTSCVVDDVMIAQNRPGKGDANRAYSQSDSLGGRTEAKYDVCSCLFVSSTPCLLDYLLKLKDILCPLSVPSF